MGRIKINMPAPLPVQLGGLYRFGTLTSLPELTVLQAYPTIHTNKRYLRDVMIPLFEPDLQLRNLTTFSVVEMSTKEWPAFSKVPC
jgi:hypothetical protein